MKWEKEFDAEFSNLVFEYQSGIVNKTMYEPATGAVRLYTRNLLNEQRSQMKAEFVEELQKINRRNLRENQDIAELITKYKEQSERKP